MTELSIEGRKSLKNIILKHEGFSQYPYIDIYGNLSIGIGRNLKSRGITMDEAMTLLDDDIRITEMEVRKLIPNWQELNDVRKIVLIDMCFNLGLTKFSNFKKLLASLEKQDYLEASKEMLNSEWANQVGKRAKELAYFMETGHI